MVKWHLLYYLKSEKYTIEFGYVSNIFKRDEGPILEAARWTIGRVRCTHRFSSGDKSNSTSNEGYLKSIHYTSSIQVLKFFVIFVNINIIISLATLKNLPFSHHCRYNCEQMKPTVRVVSIILHWNRKMTFWRTNEKCS